MPDKRPAATFLLLHATSFGAACLGTALTVMVWAARGQQWALLSDLRVWLHAAAIGGFGFWLIPAYFTVQTAYRVRSGRIAATLLPGLIVFPLLWWWRASGSS